MANTSQAPTIGQFSFTIQLPADSYINSLIASYSCNTWQLWIETTKGQTRPILNAQDQSIKDFETLDSLAFWLGSQGFSKMTVYLPESKTQPAGSDLTGGGRVMRDLIQFLEKNHYSKMEDTANTSIIKGKPISETDKDTFKTLANLASSHIDGRLIQLEAIGKLLVLAGEDKEIGYFEQMDFASIGYFLSEEMATLQELKQIQSDAEYFGRGGEL
ncbi:MAG: hypothetical protein IE928_08380 [Gammaproteobacteria bacterium]|nr:hypothetical protein [Gammaproteobacteria bacterium]